MERLKLDELVLQYRLEHQRKPTFQEVAEHVFANEVTRPQLGERRQLSMSRKRMLIGSWNNGKHLTAMKPRHLLRIASFFGVTNVRELISE